VTDTDGPPDPRLNPERSPGVDADVQGLEDIEVSREDVTIGEADPSTLTAADTEPVADEELWSLLQDLETGAPTDRKRAALALSDRERTEATERALARAALTDADADVRQFAVEALGDLGGATAERVAVEALSDDDPWVRAEAAVALDHTDRAGHARLLDRQLRDEHHAVRRNALIALWKRRGAALLPTVLAFTDDESARVREWVATILGEVADDRTVEPLESLAEDDSDVVAKTARAGLEDADTGPREGGAQTAESQRFDRPPDL
jgi:HEAT repeat protein